MPLAASQLTGFAGWVRASELEDTTQFLDENSSQEPKTIDLVQDATTDCSVVASLCAAFSRAERGHHKVFSICPTKRHIFKLAFPDLTFGHERSSQEELIRMKKILTNLEVESHLMGNISFALISTAAPVKS